MAVSLLKKESYSAYGLTGREKALGAVLGSLAGAALGLLYFGGAGGLLLMPPFALAALRVAARKKKAVLKRRLTGQLRDYMLLLAGFLRAGYALENAMRRAARETAAICGEKSLMTREAELMSRGLELRQTPETLFARFGSRTELPEGGELARLLGVARHRGGDTLKLLRALVRAMDARESLRGEIDAELTGQKLEYYVMCLMPCGILLYLSLGAPELMRTLYTRGGRLFMGLMLGLQLLAALWGDRILEKSYES